MKLPIVLYGDPLLRKKCQEVKEITAQIRQLVHDMIQTMDEANGIGLAAPQIGQSIRLFVLRRYLHQQDGKWVLSEPHVYINPKIVHHSKELLEDEEGCLSIPGIRLPVVRPAKITVEFLNIEGELVVEEIEGYNARVILHENDHINGVLFIDRADPKLRKEIEPELNKIKHPR